MTKSRARQLFREYIELLGIRHWKIKLEFCKKLDDEENLGTCATNEHWQRAKISLLKLSDPEWLKGGQDVEETMVHELLHVRWCFLDHYRKENPHFLVHEEQSIKATATAIVALRRLRDGS